MNVRSSIFERSNIWGDLMNVRSSIFERSNIWGDLNRDGLDIVYLYNTGNVEKRLHIVGLTNSWNMSGAEKTSYAKRMFTSGIEYLRKYWAERKELPDDNMMIFEHGEFGTVSPIETEWTGFVLQLPD